MVPSGYWIALVHRNLPDLTARHLKKCFHGLVGHARPWINAEGKKIVRGKRWSLAVYNKQGDRGLLLHSGNVGFIEEAAEEDPITILLSGCAQLSREGFSDLIINLISGRLNDEL
ncbi:uncharacterized protein PGTG_18156 [Puccinia graminis f. sp. tritici CRL 75-36-700-3]|uniref:Uncharacterized protein n=1 Tax=Puccinia graminis f. sp. tritici (strain CRL 75-36-700-3 / race SCCL) TaxID=418459 RepID=E3L691_PUCGT|nr:uncharacterized protein PGTG_18156 [Puccinia graminis f. sp. tritici CRL 75-36-700-3]EFP92066.2 hypothetical protein PGTG_18156 [Puccinia graminis f. sp. tritici CRL 75-36-700-3]